VLNARLTLARMPSVVGIRHMSNGFDDLLSNELTTPELTISDPGRLLDITLSHKAYIDARLDVYMSNSLGHRLPGRIFSTVLTSDGVSLRLMTFIRRRE